ncbi:MAG: hypothetical protein NT002_13950 [candidate division Zixibacteria bacterium]|nr:hypothetical protein [candidate division Zixibacteria bacterium]
MSQIPLYISKTIFHAGQEIPYFAIKVNNFADYFIGLFWNTIITILVFAGNHPGFAGGINIRDGKT